MRYRGYFWCTTTGFYYLQSRYYDPFIGRFINADDMRVLGVEQDNLLQFNLFTYCLNNPVNMIDPSGYTAIPATFLGLPVSETDALLRKTNLRDPSNPHIPAAAQGRPADVVRVGAVVAGAAKKKELGIVLGTIANFIEYDFWMAVGHSIVDFGIGRAIGRGMDSPHLAGLSPNTRSILAELLGLAAKDRWNRLVSQELPGWGGVVDRWQAGHPNCGGCCWLRGW